jgi:L-asparaginase / beta-aspartyl-peptidase
MHAIAVHGGAGDIPAADLTPQREAEYRRALEQALRAGEAMLAAGGTSLDAVVAAVCSLEDDPLFNAGHGAVIGADGTCELDAALMDGRDLRAGAVTGLKHVRNPIQLARLVMDKSPHVMLSGTGAEEFALAQGLVLVSNDYFVTALRLQELAAMNLAARESSTSAADSSAGQAPEVGTVGIGPASAETVGIGSASTGTVGAVALDAAGNLAAGTSTGGMTGKRWGRVGDSPVIGAGTYAANDACAVSATGHGEFFIRAVVAHEIAALMRHAGRSVVEAANVVVREQLPRMGGVGGVIAIARDGSIAMPFNSRGMLRGSIDSHGKLLLAIF